MHANETSPIPGTLVCRNNREFGEKSGPEVQEKQFLISNNHSVY